MLPFLSETRMFLLVSVLRHINLLHIIQPNFFQIHVNFVSFQRLGLPVRFSDQILYIFLTSLMRATRLSLIF